MATQTLMPGKPSMDGRFAPPRWLINTVEVVVIFLRGLAIFIFGIAPAVASLAAGHWAFRPVDLITAVIGTLFGIPILVTYMVIERWLGRKWKAVKDRRERKDADEFRRMERQVEESLRREPRK